MNSYKQKSAAYGIAVTAVLLAMVILLQVVLGAIKIGAVSLTFVLVPIVIGATALGVKEGAFLGLAFGVITLIMGITGADGFTNILFTEHPVLTTLTCIVKGTAAGVAAGLVFKPFRGKNELLGSFLSAFVAPTVNTGLFILGALTMADTIRTIGGENVIYFLVIVCAGVNYLIEVAINLLFAPALNRVLKAIR